MYTFLYPILFATGHTTSGVYKKWTFKNQFSISIKTIYLFLVKADINHHFLKLMPICWGGGAESGHSFFGRCILAFKRLIYVGIMSIKQLNKEKQPWVKYFFEFSPVHHCAPKTPVRLELNKIQKRQSSFFPKTLGL